ncbi:MAG: RtcB family protein [Thermodesulfobacteria bacterium]|nr:RtcB family protein [Thermodesulfobacteriota bacterium]
MDKGKLKRISSCIWEIPQEGTMRVPGYIFANNDLLTEMDDKVMQQLTNVASLPGIVKGAMAMPDAHWGYGFPIGGVAAFDPDQGGVISVGGVGYDISCGVRCHRLGLKRQRLLPKLDELMDELFRSIPAGVGSTGKIKLSASKLDDVLRNGALWAIDKGYGTKDELEYIEERGRIKDADPSKVSKLAKDRQKKQIGTLGSGNHYLEVQYVEKIYDKECASAFGLEEDDVVVSIHCGSRALGHQIGTDYLQILGAAAKKYAIPIRERELVCAPIKSPEGSDYMKAVACGINCALANRQVLGHLARLAVQRVIPSAEFELIYDVSHNTCKVEKHEVGGKMRKLFVHRKGATRAFGPGHRELPKKYKHVGQPIFIGGTMGTCSYILAGTESGEELAWGSACHGAGRSMSRRAALKRWKGKGVINALRKQGIILKAASLRGAAEEAPDAYKDVRKVVEVTHEAGLAKKVALLKPLAVIKG